jgi:hypothetical protein
MTGKPVGDFSRIFLTILLLNHQETGGASDPGCWVVPGVPANSVTDSFSRSWDFWCLKLRCPHTRATIQVELQGTWAQYWTGWTWDIGKHEPQTLLQRLKTSGFPGWTLADMVD